MNRNYKEHDKILLEKEILGLKQTILEKEAFIKTLRESRARAIAALELIINSSKCNNVLLLLNDLISTAEATLDDINNQKGKENESINSV